MRFALARTYLAKFAALQVQLVAMIQPEAAHVDAIIATWSKLPNCFMKSTLNNAIRNNHAVAVSHVSDVLALESMGSPARGAGRRRQTCDRRQAEGHDNLHLDSVSRAQRERLLPE